MNEFMLYLERFQTERVVAWLRAMQIGDLVHNPYFLGGVAAVAILSLIMRWRSFLAICVGLTGFAYLISYTLQQGTQLDGLGNSTLLVFVGGGAVIVGLVIYLLFIKSD
jgi:ABC-type glycerol-3-phosphate transport system permease component